MDDHSASWNVLLLGGGVGYVLGAASALLLLGLVRAMRRR